MCANAIILQIFLAVAYEIQGYTFPCLDQCQCNTDEEAIHCHNKQRTELVLPESRLRGFTVLGITNNALKTLPDEKLILEKLPDLKAIDVEGNRDFDCDTIKKYTSLKIYSSCGGKDILVGQKLPDIEEPTKGCNFECQWNKHYEVLHNYIKELLKMLKKKYTDWDNQEVFQNVQDFFVKIAKKIEQK